MHDDHLADPAPFLHDANSLIERVMALEWMERMAKRKEIPAATVTVPPVTTNPPVATPVATSLNPTPMLPVAQPSSNAAMPPKRPPRTRWSPRIDAPAPPVVSRGRD